MPIRTAQEAFDDVYSTLHNHKDAIETLDRTIADDDTRIAALESDLAALKAKAQAEAAKEEQKECDCGYCQRRYGLGCSRKIEAEAKRIIGELKVEQEAIRSERGLKPKTTGLTFMEAVAAMRDGKFVKHKDLVASLYMLGPFSYQRNILGAYLFTASDFLRADWEIVE